MKLSLIVLTVGILAQGQAIRSVIELEQRYHQTIRELEEGGPSTELSSVLNGLAALYFEERAFGRAETLTRRSLVVEQALPNPRKNEIARRLNNLAAACSAQGKSAEAATLIRESLEIYEGLSKSADKAFALNTLGVLELRSRQFAAAASHFEQATHLMVGESVDLGKTLANLAVAQSELRLTWKSAESWSKALAMAGTDGHANDPEYGAMLCLYAKTLSRAGRKSESVQTQRRCRAILDQARTTATATIDRSDFR